MTGAERIIDAGLNRAREAVRVLEDIARFALDDHALCADLKELRHGLREAAASLPCDHLRLLAHRDTPGDVGTGIKTRAELRRDGLSDVASAAAARLGESLRSVEEVCKVLAPGSAPAFESLRYRGYTLEKRLLLALATGRGVQWRLCVLITADLCAGHSWERVAELAIEGGADCLQLREKTAPDGDLLARARRLVALARPRGVSVIINDRADIAMAAGADGVHVGQTDLPVAEVRRLAGGRLLVGVSTANLEQAHRAIGDGADYCGVGPMFATTTAADKPEISGPEYLHAYLADPVLAARPHLAIGGIGPGNVHRLAAVGCRGVAVCAAVCGAPDPAAVCRTIKALVASSGGPG